MSDLQFSHTNIAMATHETTGRTILWDRDTDTFGSGYDLPEALEDLAGNYGSDYRKEETDGETPSAEGLSIPSSVKNRGSNE